MVSDKELSYIAGLFDGEGSITLVRHRSNRTHSPQVSPLLIMKLFFGVRNESQTIQSLMAGD